MMSAGGAPQRMRVARGPSAERKRDIFVSRPRMAVLPLLHFHEERVNPAQPGYQSTHRRAAAVRNYCISRRCRTSTHTQGRKIPRR